MVHASMFLYKLRITQLLKYLYDLIPKGSCIYNTRNLDKIETYYCRTDLLLLFVYDS